MSYLYFIIIIIAICVTYVLFTKWLLSYNKVKKWYSLFIKINEVSYNLEKIYPDKHFVGFYRDKDLNYSFLTDVSFSENILYKYRLHCYTFLIKEENGTPLIIEKTIHIPFFRSNKKTIKSFNSFGNFISNKKVEKDFNKLLEKDYRDKFNLKVAFGF